MNLAYLADHPAHLPTLATWLHGQWGHLYPDGSLATRTTRLRGQLERDRVPMTFVALNGRTSPEPVGTASLVVCDMETHAHLTPWLASVFVPPERRRQGVASALVRHAMAQARLLRVGELYLYTPDMERLYARLGWETIERLTYKGMRVALMRAKP